MRRLRLELPLILLALVALPAASAVAATTHTVTISGTSFEPAEMTIEVGDTVTWVNDGGQHNVVADGGGFTSGPPSTDLWQFSHTFHQGGEFDYHCEVHGDMGMVGTVTVEGVFGDPFESGDTGAWMETFPMRPNCNCYFSPDCPPEASFCDWGPGGFGTEDICTWRSNKPTAPGTGCDIGYSGGWIPGICDGYCVPPGIGSELGGEDPALLRTGIQLWADALLNPSIAGGGPVDPELVEQVMALKFRQPDGAMYLGRQVNDLLIAAGIPEFYMHFCAFEGHPDEPDPNAFVDLSNDPCRATAGRRAIEALLAELEKPGSGAPFIDSIRLVCADWQSMFMPRCAVGEGALACLAERAADTAFFLKTPRATPERQPPLALTDGER